jgi:hypothetical protein
LGDKYIYQKDDSQLSFEEIETSLKSMNVQERVEYLNEVSNNKSKNRFYID